MKPSRGVESKVMTVRNKREAVCAPWLPQAAIPERNAWSLVSLNRITIRYQCMSPEKPELVYLSDCELHRFVYRECISYYVERLHVNHKKIYRLYWTARVSVWKRKRRKGIMVERQPFLLPYRPDRPYIVDGFCYGSPDQCRRIKYLTIVDDLSKECLDIPVATGISDEQIMRTVDGIAT